MDVLGVVVGFWSFQFFSCCLACFLGCPLPSRLLCEFENLLGFKVINQEKRPSGSKSTTKCS